MSWTEGVSQCWPLAKECGVWWEAWSAIAGFLAVAATSVLGYYTYKLGKAANKASRTALDISLKEAKTREERDATEAMLILNRIAGEISQAQVRVNSELNNLSLPATMREFISSDRARTDLFNRLDAYKFPISDLVIDRTHYLDPAISSRLVRAIYMFRSMQGEMRSWGATAETIDFDEWYMWIGLTLIVISEDLKIVSEACKDACKTLGLHDDESLPEKLASFQRNARG